jgi:hypothetical protein
VVVAARPSHLERAQDELEGLGIATDRFLASGQLVPLDASELHRGLPVGGHVDEQRFQALAGTVLERVAARWRSVRVFGEPAGLFWRDGEQELAREVEQHWGALGERLGLTSVCAYPGRNPSVDLATHIRECHDAVLAA